jgi:hypothetical protein
MALLILILPLISLMRIKIAILSPEFTMGSKKIGCHSAITGGLCGNVKFDNTACLLSAK